MMFTCLPSAFGFNGSVTHGVSVHVSNDNIEAAYGSERTCNARIAVYAYDDNSKRLKRILQTNVVLWVIIDPQNFHAQIGGCDACCSNFVAADSDTRCTALC